MERNVQEQKALDELLERLGIVNVSYQEEVLLDRFGKVLRDTVIEMATINEDGVHRAISAFAATICTIAKEGHEIMALQILSDTISGFADNLKNDPDSPLN